MCAISACWTGKGCYTWLRARHVRDLSVPGRDRLLRVAAGEVHVCDASALAINLEPRGGAPGAGGSTGPVLFSGTLIRQWP